MARNLQAVLHGVDPKVTIITACRNAVETIEQTILSVIDQDYSNIEYIIVDAESDDGTADVIRKYQRDVALWIREPDKGIADAWNKGIRRASGDIVGIINGDDFYTPGAVKRAVALLEEQQDVAFVYGDLNHVDLLNGYECLVKGRQFDKKILVRGMWGVPHPTVFVRKKVYLELGLFDIGYRIAPDYEFLRRVTYKGVKGGYIPQTLAVMRGGGVSETKRLQAMREVRAISVAYGYDRFSAFCYFSFKCLCLFMGQILKSVGVSPIRYRKIGHALGVSNGVR